MGVLREGRARQGGIAKKARDGPLMTEVQSMALLTGKLGLSTELAARVLKAVST